MTRLIRTIINSWRWLRTTLILLGLTFIGLAIWLSFSGLPNCLRTLDAQLMQDRINDLGQAVTELQDFKQVVTMKEEAARVKLAKK